MFELTRFEARRHLSQALGVTAGMFGLVMLVVLIFPAYEQAGDEFEEILEGMPDAMQAAFGAADIPFATIEGFLIIEVYQFVWMMVIGGYLAYAAATLIAGEISDGNIDVLLMTPISRRQIVLEKFLSMVPDVVLISLGTYLAVAIGTVLIEEPIDLFWVGMVHLLSVPYLLACVAFGLVLSVVVSSERRAQIAAFAAIAASYVLEALVQDTDYEIVGDFMFAHYLTPGDILIENEVATIDAVVLLTITMLLLVVAAAIFERADITT
ncbi:MAG: ABC transporter permease subunit [Halobacteriota archaeon]